MNAEPVFTSTDSDPFGEDNQRYFSEIFCGFHRAINRSWLSDSTNSIILSMLKHVEIMDLDYVCDGLGIVSHASYSETVNYALLWRLMCQPEQYLQAIGSCLSPEQHASAQTIFAEKAHKSQLNLYQALSLNQRRKDIASEHSSPTQAAMNSLLLCYHDLPKGISDRLFIAFDRDKVFESRFFIGNLLKSKGDNKDYLSTMKRVFNRVLEFSDQKLTAEK